MKATIVGPYPPPFTGWSMAIQEEREALEKGGVKCNVLNIGTKRRIKSKDYTDVQSAKDLLLKLLRYAMKGNIFWAHINGESIKGLEIVLLAQLTNLMFFRRSCLTFHAGDDQRYFPHRGSLILKMAWLIVFNLSKVVICNSEEVRKLILNYRLEKGGVYAFPAFSPRSMNFVAVPLDAVKREFIGSHSPVLFSYFAYRPDFEIPLLLKAVEKLKERYPRIGLIAIDDRTHGDPVIQSEALRQIAATGMDDQVILTGNVDHEMFLSILKECDLYVRTPLTDGVCSSILESLWLGIPVLAADNGTRPEAVMTFGGGNLESLVDVLIRFLDGGKKIEKGKEMPGFADKDNVGQLIDVVIRNYSKEKTQERDGIV